VVEEKPGHGWGTAAGLALATASFAVLSPGLLIFLPLSLFLLSLPPRRPFLAAGGALLLWVVLTGGDSGGSPLWYIERGWVLVLGAWFMLMVVLLPGAGFFTRALAALGASAATVTALLVLVPSGWPVLDWAIGRRIQETATDAAALWTNSAVSEGLSGRFTDALKRFSELQSLLHPALIGLESLAALGVAWWAYRRLAARERHPLGRLRDFRFGDHLVWVLIAGILLLVLPLGEAAVRAGSNVVAFMGALYALRGAAILLVFSGLQGVGGAFVAGLVVLFLYPVALMTAVVVGLSDTWFDLRARRAAARPDS
jgi:hypothetical protein